MEFFMAAQRPHQAVQSASGRRRRNALRQEYEIGVRMLAPQRLQWPIDKLMGSAVEGPGWNFARHGDTVPLRENPISFVKDAALVTSASNFLPLIDFRNRMIYGSQSFFLTPRPSSDLPGTR
jgi:hypothetical protein